MDVKSQYFGAILFLTVSVIAVSYFLARGVGFLDGHFFAIHLTSELLSAFVFLSVIVVLCQKPMRDHSPQENVLILGLGIVAIIDYVHALSYIHTQASLTDSHSGSELFFWFVARITEILMFIALVTGRGIKGKRSFWVFSAVVVSGLLIFLGNYQLHHFSESAAGKIETVEFGNQLEAVLGFLYFLVSSLFFVRYLGSKKKIYLYFSVTAYSMAICVWLTLVYDAHLAAHVYKIFAAAAIFFGVLLEELQSPYRTLSKEKRKLTNAVREISELKDALDQHAIVATTDRAGRILSVNQKFCDIAKYDRDELIGNTHSILNSGVHTREFFKSMWNRIASGYPWQGDICNKAKDGSQYWVNTTIVPLIGESGRPEKYIAIRADITERKKAELEVHRLASYDELTNLPNRRFLKTRLSELKNQSDEGPNFHALLLIDMDDFKNINDSMGHPMGDALLVKVASRLEFSSMNSRFCARIGGDEFVVLLPFIGASKHAASIRAKEQAMDIKGLLSRPYSIDHQKIRISPSIGVSIFDSDNSDFSEVMKQADIAMYQSKDMGKDKVSFFEQELQQQIEQRSVMISELRSAVDRNEFDIHFQPIVTESKEVVSYEALLRWNNSVLGSVPPMDFIPIAEETRLIISIGDWVLQRVCSVLASWKSDSVKRKLSIAVNVSSIQFGEDGFVERVSEIAKHYGVNPENLKLEITESVMLKQPDAVILKMKKLVEEGFQLSLDDFGTGFSSLSYITKFPIDIIKVDKSFIDKMLVSRQDESVVKSILNLSAGVNKKVVAEGIETVAQFEYLKALGCHYFQGYYLGKPAPLPEKDKESDEGDVVNF